jgi:hypothetical protein
MTIRGAEVLEFLRPEGGWIITGNDYEGIDFVSCEPITKAQFEAGFAAYDAWKAQQELQKTTARQAILDRLGITAEEAALLLG